MLYDSILNKCNGVKNLGVIFDRKLSFTFHVNEVVAGSYRNLRFIFRNPRHIVGKIFILPFSSFVFMNSCGGKMMVYIQLEVLLNLIY